MKNQHRVYFEFMSGGESGQDCYCFSEKNVAAAKIEELKQTINDNFSGEMKCEIIDEDDFYGIIDHQSGDFAKVFFA